MTKQALVSYRFDGGEYSFSFPAEDWADAEAKLRAIRSTATLTGWPSFGVPANSLTLPLAAIFARLYTAIRNMLR